MAASPFWNWMPSRIKPAKPKAKGIAAHPLLFWCVVSGMFASGWIVASVAMSIVGAAKLDAQSTRDRVISESSECIRRAQICAKSGHADTAFLELRNFTTLCPADHPDRIRLFNETFDRIVAELEANP